MNIQITVNGQSRGGDVEPRLLLVHFLRENLGLTAQKSGATPASVAPVSFA